MIQPVEIEAAEVYSFQQTSRQNYNAGEIQMREQLRRTFQMRLQILKKESPPPLRGRVRVGGKLL